MAEQIDNHHYLALTIGPVVKTLQEARKTRELWAASYLLSTLMKYLIEQLDPGQKHILIPQIPASVHEEALYGAGIYPDRLFMKADGWTAAQVNKCIDAAMRKLAEDCLLKSDWENDEGKEARIGQALKFWRPFFRIRYVIKKLDGVSDGALSYELTPFLENAELEDTCFPEEPESNELLELFQEDRIYKAPLSQALQGANRGVYDPIMTYTSFFPSTPEIAAMELHTKVPGALLEIADELRKEKVEESETYFQKIEEHKELKKYFRSRHKYFCIIQADGDGIGQAVKKLNNEKDYKSFSETLAEFGAEAALAINEFGGKPIYIGGDDLLFLSPVQNGMETIFDLILKLDKKFPKEKLHPDASLSYGLNIVYNKFPLFEAIGDAYDILKNAKKYENKGGKKKNAVSFRFTKHSGSFFSATFSKKFLSEAVVALQTFEGFNPKGRKGLVSSLMYKVQTLEPLLENMARQEEIKKANDPEYQFDLISRLEHFFDAYFNEWKGESGFKEQRKATGDLLLAAYREAGIGKKNWLSLFYAVMRLIDFISEPAEIQKNDPENIPAAAE